ncbi:hypothetical protein PAXRUDRAFT_160767 [Paxillus rubicundulus Ve08.2h10]|uniref:Uncharacterized protein n=1 Tax=Paxillus rubicundulus Ve08.2h10 TaxID=930991 RepID=A0A0D0C9T5_9AGAM|nr:hypothetical protein PAXRUDRAFT_160767 [Paxillus rubicundulus Ve08.2h10]
MHREWIRSAPSWRGGPPCCDCVYVLKHSDEQLTGFKGMHIACLLLLFSIKTINNMQYPCALVHWFSTVGDEPCRETGMWIVEPDVNQYGSPVTAVIHLDCVFRSAHLLGKMAGNEFLPTEFTFHETLDRFTAFYVNKFADHHTHQITF